MIDHLADYGNWSIPILSLLNSDSSEGRFCMWGVAVKNVVKFLSKLFSLSALIDSISCRRVSGMLLVLEVIAVGCVTDSVLVLCSTVTWLGEPWESELAVFLSISINPFSCLILFLILSLNGARMCLNVFACLFRVNKSFSFLLSFKTPTGCLFWLCSQPFTAQQLSISLLLNVHPGGNKFGWRHLEIYNATKQ